MNLCQADGQHLAFGFLLVGYTPAEVYFAPGDDAALFAQLAQLRKSALDQLIALGVHVPEGGGDDMADLRPAEVDLVDSPVCALAARRADLPGWLVVGRPTEFTPEWTARRDLVLVISAAAVGALTNVKAIGILIARYIKRAKKADEDA